MKKKEIRVSIADDHDLILQGLRRIISMEDDIAIYGEAKNGEEVMVMLKRYQPDVLLLDVNMPVIDGITLLQKIKQQYENVKVIMLTIENDRLTINKAINIGADGYVLKDSAGTQIVSAIRTVYNGEKYIDKALVSLLFSEIKNKNAEGVFDCLSQREIEILLNISRGLSNKEIADALYISEKTVKNYITNIFRKLNVSHRVQATIFSIENNIEDYYKSKFGNKE